MAFDMSSTPPVDTSLGNPSGSASRRGLWRTPVLGPALFAAWCADARRKADWMAPFITQGDRLLEVGSGPGSLLRTLRDRGFQTDGLDVSDTAYISDLAPLLYDGDSLPFRDDAYDAAIIATVLHHVEDPETLLRETGRIAPKLLVIEDIYHSPFQRRLTKIADSITNLEFIGHPHSNKDDAGWRALFDNLGFRLIHQSEKPYAGAFLQALYVLERR